MKQPVGNKNETLEAQHENEPTREQLEEEFRSDDQGNKLFILCLKIFISHHLTQNEFTYNRHKSLIYFKCYHFQN